MSRLRRAENEPPDDLSYEDFDDVPLIEDEDAVDLDALDEELSDTEPAIPSAPSPPKPIPEPLRLPLDTADLGRPAGRTPSRPARVLSDPRGDVGPAPRPSRPAKTPTPLRLPFEDDSGTMGMPSEAPAKADPVPDPSPEVQPGSEPRELEPDLPAPSSALGAKSSPPALAIPQVVLPPADLAGPAIDGAPPSEPEPAPPDWVYCVLIALPEDLSVLVLELRSAGEVIDMPPPGLPLVGSFRAPAIEAVEQALAAWCRSHLPLEIELTSVVAEVVGSQQYVAAWALQPEAALRRAQDALSQALESRIVPLPETSAAFEPRLSIGDCVPPRRYPHLVGRMQRDFEPMTWRATDLLLVRKGAEADAGAWEIVRRFE